MSRTSAAARHRISANWDQFWFGEIPGTTFSILRVLFGLLVSVTLLAMSPVSVFWSPDGLHLPAPPESLRAEILQHGSGPLLARGLWLSTLVASVMMAAGAATRVSTIATFTGTLALLKWNAAPFSGAERVMLTVLFCLCWADCSGQPSFDGYWRKGDGRIAPVLQPAWPLRLIRYQVALVYLTTGAWKLISPAWRSGSAIHYTLAANLFHRFPTALPGQLDWLLTGATYGTLIWELAFPVMVLHPFWRRFALTTGILIHFGLFVAMELTTFSLVMIASYVSFLDPWRLGSQPWGLTKARPGETNKGCGW